jgi:hypothetical protein
VPFYSGAARTVYITQCILRLGPIYSARSFSLTSSYVYS